MPCSSDHMNANTYEKKLSKVACLLDELNGKKKIDPCHWDGYHPLIYNKSDKIADSLVAELCSRLKLTDVSKHSLEMQVWWRDHNRKDKERERASKEHAKQALLRASGISKLSLAERRALGI